MRQFADSAFYSFVFDKQISRFFCSMGDGKFLPSGLPTIWQQNLFLFGCNPLCAANHFTILSSLCSQPLWQHSRFLFCS
jgi:hypothetical protein